MAFVKHLHRTLLVLAYQGLLISLNTQLITVKLWKLIQIKMIYVLNLINYYPVYISS